ncbi:MAG: hypothetical protein V4641_31865 [Pseudomonadota bacterium]
MLLLLPARRRQRLAQVLQLQLQPRVKRAARAVDHAAAQFDACVGLEAQNLNNAKTRQVMEQHAGMFTRQLFMSGPRYVIQAQYSF